MRDATEQAADPTGAASEDAAAADFEPEFVDGVLQPLPDGFPDHEITIVVADDATSSEGILATTLQAHSEEHSPVPIDIEIRDDFESFPTWEALQYIRDDEDGQQGYLIEPLATVGGIADTAAADVEGSTGQSLATVAPIVGLEIGRWYITQCVEVEWEPTIEALVAESQERPGEVRYMAQGAGGGVDLGFFSTMMALDAGEFDAIPIGGTVEQATATAACEGDVTNTTYEPIIPHLQNERLNILMVNGEERVEEYPDVPSAGDLGIEDSLVSGRQLITGVGVPEIRLQWLYELFAAIANDPDYVAAREEIPGVQVIVEDRAEARATEERNYEIVTDVLDSLGLLFEG